ncbi:MAG: outer membrane beta-barrel protein, partial [Terricaulis sp.]
MRKLLSTLALAALMAGAATSAQAMEGWYGRADVGYSVDGEVDVSFFDGEETFSDTADLDDGWMADVGVGYAYGNGFRAELELAERNNEVNSTSTDVDARSLMVNGFYDFNRGGRFQPYVGVGVGYAKVDADTVDDSNWAWQALAGVGVEINDRLTLDVGYRYFNVDDLEFASIADASYTHQAVTVGLRFQFGAAAAPPPPAVV